MKNIGKEGNLLREKEPSFTEIQGLSDSECVKEKSDLYITVEAWKEETICYKYYMERYLCQSQKTILSPRWLDGASA